MTKVAAFIPARGGSKGIPLKNIKNFNGKPLIYWTIKNALQSKLLNDVYVSSDSDRILEIAKKYGSDVIKRPKKISGDRASTESAIIHMIETINTRYDYIVLLEPTNPLKRKKDIDNSIKRIISYKYDSLFSATKLIDFMIWKNFKNKLKSINYNYKKRGLRQSRKDDLYLENGNIYVFKPKILIKNHNRLGGKIGIIENTMDQYMEIDEPNQWRLAETLHKNLLKQEKL